MLTLVLATDFTVIINMTYIIKRSSDEVAEWLRRWTANPLGSPRVSSNLILVENFLVMLSNTTKRQLGK